MGKDADAQESPPVGPSVAAAGADAERPELGSTGIRTQIARTNDDAPEPAATNGSGKEPANATVNHAPPEQTSPPTRTDAPQPELSPAPATVAPADADLTPGSVPGTARPSADVDPNRGAPSTEATLDQSLNDAVILGPIPEGEEDFAGVKEQGLEEIFSSLPTADFASRTGLSEQTRELPVLQAEELWFAHHSPPESLLNLTSLTVEGRSLRLMSCIAVQTYERRYRVLLDGQSTPLVLKQGAKDAPFVRYGVEWRALQDVHAENVVPGLPRVHAFWTDDDYQYLLIDPSEGHAYVHLYDADDVTMVDHVRILREVARLLGRLHQSGYILSSLRPTSFDVKRNGAKWQVTLTDFLNLCETVERPPYPLASPYTAPEIGEQGPADEGADIYSLGALLFRAITGHELAMGTPKTPYWEVPSVLVPMVHQVISRTLSLPSERFFDIRDVERALMQLEREQRPQIRVDVAMKSSTGMNPLRIVNQDSGAYLEFKAHHRTQQRHCGYYCVADGMGGHEDGDRASELAVQGALRAFQELLFDTDHDIIRANIAAYCKKIAAAGSRCLVETVAREGGARRMGTTFTGVLLVDNQLALAHVGDSRAILLREGKLSFLSEDHSLVGMMVKAGQMTQEQAEVADEKNILMRSVGADHVIRAELFDGFENTQGVGVLDACPGDRLVLVSDGVWGMLPRPTMRDIMTEAPNAGAAADTLCREAIRRGGVDNVIVVALFFSQDPPIGAVHH